MYFLEVLKTNKAAISCYSKCGFNIVQSKEREKTISMIVKKRSTDETEIKIKSMSGGYEDLKMFKLSDEIKLNLEKYSR